MEDRECCIRMDVCRKRSLYTRCIIFGFMSIFSMLIWLVTGMGMFWPIWVMAAYILTVFVESLQICSLGCFRNWFCFLTPEWEHNEVNRCMNFNCYMNCNPNCSTSTTQTSCAAATNSATNTAATVTSVPVSGSTTATTPA